MYLNRASIIGNLTRDPELRALPSGKKVVSFSMATNETWKDKQTGEKKESVDYHNIIFYDPAASILAQYVKKGHMLFVEGKIKTRSWEDQATGQKKYRTEIVGDTFKFGRNKKQDGQDHTSQVNHNEDVPTVQYGETQTTTQNTGVIEYPDDDIDPSEIPFS